jgi:hypothetical protein
LFDGSGVPHEIESFTSGVAVVNAIVGEVPRDFDVSAWCRTASGDESIHPFRVEECVMRSVVAKYEEASDGEAHGQPEKEDRSPLSVCTSSVNGSMYRNTPCARVSHALVLDLS